MEAATAQRWQLSVFGRFTHNRNPVLARPAWLSSIVRQKMRVFILSLALFLTGCGSTDAINGRFVGRDGLGIPNAEVVCWKRQGFMQLPLRVAETKTDQEGRFSVVVDERVDSIQARTSDTLDKIRTGTVTLRGLSSQEVIIKEEPNQPLQPTPGS